MFANLKNTLAATAVILLLTTAAYPLIVTGIGHLAFPHQTDGSLVFDERGNALGSELIGQDFNGTGYFHPRPSAVGFNAAGSGGSNLGPTNAALAVRVNSTLAAVRDAERLAPGAAVPADAVTASGSGLDPHISVANALNQVPRIAAARHLDAAVVRGLVDRYTESRSLGILGEPGVNVLRLNLALDHGETAKAMDATELDHGDAQVYGMAAAIALGLAIVIGSILMGRLVTRTLGSIDGEPAPERQWCHSWPRALPPEPR